MTLRVAVTGAAGRMGRTLVQALHESDNATLTQAIVKPDHPLLGKDAGEIIDEHTGVSMTDALSSENTDCLIEFTAPQASLEHARWASEHGIATVVGTTALNPEQHQELENLAKKTPILWAPNMSPGVALMLHLVAIAAENLKEYATEVHETHHLHKLDAPSGTALRLGEAIAKARGVELDQVARHNDNDTDNKPGKDGEIKFSVSRIGEVIGEHSALFANDMERLEIHHRAFDRLLFARSAIRAALWLTGEKPGALYGIQDTFKV